MSTDTFIAACVRTLTERDARIEAVWRMTPSERVAAMRRGDLSMEQLCAWAGRFPEQVPLIHGEYEFIAAFTPEICE
jgi:hypothetical protein